MKPPRDWRTPLGLFVAALAVRALPAASTFSEGQVFLRDPDAWYQLRRVLYAVVNFPAALSFDAYVQFPHGARIGWVAGFDWLLAALLWPVHRVGGEPALEIAAAWIPPVLGATTVWVTWAVARRHFGARAALWSAALLCVLGGHFVASQVGAFDRRMATSLASVVLFGAASRAVESGLRAQGRRATVWVGAIAGAALLVWLGASVYAGANEPQPLFVVGGRLSGYTAALQLSAVVYAFPLLWVYGWYEASRREPRGPRVLLLVWSGALGCAVLLEKRFVDTFSLAFALQTGLAAADLWKRAGLEEGSIRARLAAAAALAALYPLHGNYTTHLDNLVRAVQDETLRLSPFHRANRILVGVSQWLERYTPPTSGWLDASRRPEYGVMAPWSAGHIVQQVGRRPTVADGSREEEGAASFFLERRFWAAPSLEADAILEELGVRYVLVAGGDPRLRSYDHFSTYRALYLRDGSGVVAGEGQASTRASGRYRMVMESQRLEPDAADAFVKVYEFVPGARLRGTTRPEQLVGLSLAIDTNRGRRFHYRDRVRSGPDGGFEFVVPYASSGGPGSDDPEWIRVAPRYALRCGLATSWVEVSERQVRSGATMRVGDPCTASRADSPAGAGSRHP